MLTAPAIKARTKTMSRTMRGRRETSRSWPGSHERRFSVSPHLQARAVSGDVDDCRRNQPGVFQQRGELLAVPLSPVSGMQGDQEMGIRSMPALPFLFLRSVTTVAVARRAPTGPRR